MFFSNPQNKHVRGHSFENFSVSKAKNTIYKEIISCSNKICPVKSAVSAGNPAVHISSGEFLITTCVTGSARVCQRFVRPTVYCNTAVLVLLGVCQFHNFTIRKKYISPGYILYSLCKVVRALGAQHTRPETAREAAPQPVASSTLRTTQIHFLVH